MLIEHPLPSETIEAVPEQPNMEVGGPNTFEFPISNNNQPFIINNISSSTLPNFHGSMTKDPNTFLFEFYLLCRSYDNTIDTKKMNFFPYYTQGYKLEMVYGHRKRCCYYLATDEG